jgi:two-component system phosphate regulon response regulator PhoB
MGPTILIVDDEADISSALAFNLEREGFRAIEARSGTAALAILERSPRPDLVVLDLMLPDVSGTEICKRLRREPQTKQLPILMLTAKSDTIDRVVGFEAGADDYVTKPFSVRELVLRIRAILRRRQGETATTEHVQIGSIRLDTAGHRVWVEGEEVGLTALEFRLLSTLIERSGRVQTRDSLLTTVWEMNGEVTTRTVDTHVRRLRKKLGAASAHIETLRGVGYRFRADA